MTFIVTTNVFASQPPERRPTGTPHARAKRMAFLVATTSLPAVYRPNCYARTTTAGTPHARANYLHGKPFPKVRLVYLRQTVLVSCRVQPLS